MSRGPVRVLELRSVRGTGGGPEKTILNGAALGDPSRAAVTVCYIRDRRDPVFRIGVEAERLGIDYVEVEEAHSADWRVVPALRRLIRERRIDIVHAHDYKTNLLALILGRLENVTPLSTVHGWTGQSAMERFVYYPADKRLLAWFPRLVAVSSDIRDELVRHGARQETVDVVLNCIDPRAFAPKPASRARVRAELGIPASAIVVGAVGRTERQKRFDLLLDAMAPIVRERPEVVLVVAGDGSLREELQQQAASMGIAESCRFAGHRSDIADLHAAFDLFVQSSEYEGTPNAVLEAMACGTPIVMTDAGGSREIARPGLEALMVPVRDVAALRAAIVESLTNPGEARRRSAAARARVETELSFEARVARIESIYLALSGDGAAAPASVRYAG